MNAGGIGLGSLAASGAAAAGSQGTADTIVARVVSVDGDQVELAWGHRRFTAESRTPLTVGAEVRLQIEQAAPGKMLLRMVDDSHAHARSAGRGVPAAEADSSQANSPAGGPQARAEAPQTAARAGVPAAEAPRNAPRPDGPPPTAARGDRPVPPALRGAERPRETAPGAPAVSLPAAKGSPTAAGASGWPPLAAAPAALPHLADAMGTHLESGQPRGVQGQVAVGTPQGTSGENIAQVEPPTIPPNPSAPLEADDLLLPHLGTAPARPPPRAPTAAATPRPAYNPAAPTTLSTPGSAAPDSAAGSAIEPRGGAGTVGLAADLLSGVPGESENPAPARFGAPAGSARPPAGTSAASTVPASPRVLPHSQVALAEQAVQNARRSEAPPPTRPTWEPHTEPPLTSSPGAAQPTEPQASTARLALPAYARLSVPGETGHRQSPAGATLARHALILPPSLLAAGPALNNQAALGARLAGLGLPADPAHLAAASALLVDGQALTPAAVHTLAEQIIQARATPADLPLVAQLARWGLPTTPGAVELLRGALAAEQPLRQAWSDALGHLQQHAAPEQSEGSFGRLAHAALAAWTPPTADAPALAGWLARTVHDVGTSLEAKLGIRGEAPGALPSPPSASEDPAAIPAPLLAGGEQAARVSTDTRMRLHALQQAAGQPGAPTTASAGQALDRLSAPLQTEQLLNRASPSADAPRWYCFTLPAHRDGQQGAIELRVREREHRAPGDPTPPADVVQLRLALPHLGEVAVDLAVRGERVTCRFVTDEDFAAALLRASADDLVRGLARVGYDEPSVQAVARTASAARPAAGAATGVSRLDLRA